MDERRGITKNETGWTGGDKRSDGGRDGLRALLGGRRPQMEDTAASLTPSGLLLLHVFRTARGPGRCREHRSRIENCPHTSVSPGPACVGPGAERRGGEAGAWTRNPPCWELLAQAGSLASAPGPGRPRTVGPDGRGASGQQQGQRPAEGRWLSEEAQGATGEAARFEQALRATQHEGPGHARVTPQGDTPGPAVAVCKQ